MTRGFGIGISLQPFSWALGRMQSRGDGWRMWALGPLYLAWRL